MAIEAVCGWAGAVMQKPLVNAKKANENELTDGLTDRQT